MEKITKEEAMNYLHIYGAEIHCRSIYTGWQYTKFYDSDSNFLCYKSRGCVIIKDIRDNPNEEKRIVFHIHQISNDAEVCAMWRFILENEKVENFKRTIMLYVCGTLPDEISSFEGLWKYTHKGINHSDSDIRKMTKNDVEIINGLCSDSCGDDNHYGESEAKTFYSWYEKAASKKRQLLGLFNGDKLEGLVSVDKYEKTGLAQVCDLFIHKGSRRLGFGGRLVKSALSIYPEMKYFYQVYKQNEASNKLALSLGFEFAGAELFALDEH